MAKDIKAPNGPLYVTLPPETDDCSSLLGKLALVSDSDLGDFISLKASDIFLSQSEDIQSCLSPRSKDTLVKVHKVLCEKAIAQFDFLKGRKAINRQSKHTLLNDITVLGCSLGKDYPTKDLDKIFHSETNKVTCGATLDSLMLKLEEVIAGQKHQSILMEELNEQSRILRSENDALRLQITELMTFKRDSNACSLKTDSDLFTFDQRQSSDQ